ncbi:putative N-acetylglucosaminyl-phosphatidylinositol de-N-acetylase [Nymphaea thermarum]|nr:putative N-acetylglucosaminyl-phosphatidylinositol de-N-acetylase [Nymphaea thermarum]
MKENPRCLSEFRTPLYMLGTLCHNGDAEGKGTLRKDELYQACVILKVQLQRVKIIDHPDLQDGFDKSWSPVLIKDLIEEAVIAWEIDTVITFDNYGISGHRNHQDVHTGLRMLMMSNLQRDIEAWELISTNIARKYCGPVDVWWSIFESYFCQTEEICFLPNKSPCLSANAMAQHSSQWVSEAVCGVLTIKPKIGSSC